MLTKNLSIWIWIGQSIGDSGTKMISEVLSSVSTLTKLDMSCYEMSEVDM